MLCDLHIHSSCSDGTNAPEALIPLAQAAGVRAVALCDHNTVAGLARFQAAAAGTEVIAVSGVEITTGYRDKELHIVGLFIGPEVRDALTEYLGEINRRKEESNRILLECLQAGGYPITAADLARQAGQAMPNRVHVARALVEKGFLSSISQAFDTLLADGGPYYRSAEKLDTLEVIGFLRCLGILPVLAHPMLNLSEEFLQDLLPKARARGLLAMETLYPLYDPAQSALAARLAAEHGLLPSGGSDFHGANKPEIRLGTGTGSLAVPLAYFEALQQLHQKIQGP